MGWLEDAMGGISEGLDNARNAAADAASAAAGGISEGLGAAQNVAEGAAAAAAGGISEGLGAAQNVAAGAASAAAEAVGTAATNVYSSFGGSVGVEQEGNLKLEDGSYALPEPVINETESHELDVLTQRYDDLNKPGLISRAGGAIEKVVPGAIKDAVGGAGEAISEAEAYKAAMKIVAEGFGAIEKQAASASVSAEYAINQINRGKQQEKISSIEEVCLLRAYDLAKVVHAERGGHLGLAFFEGAATGAPGFAGIPFNIVLSTFLFFRAVQSIAMLYGYDVHADPDEMVVASDVIMAAYGAGDNSGNHSVAVGYVGKIMAISEAEVAKQVVAKGWTAMAERGGVTLLLTQLRALAHASAKKALTNAGKQGLEKSVFNSLFTQIGKRLTQNVIKGAVPVFGGVIGALFDSGVMGRMLDFAEVFYHKRFILEKEFRIRSLTEDSTFFQVVEEETGIDAETIVEEAERAVEEEPEEYEVPTPDAEQDGSEEL